MLTVTPVAAEKIRELLEQRGGAEGNGLRVRVMGGGCSGLQYALGIATKANEGDQIYESHGIRVYVDPKTYPYVEGSEIDYTDELMGGGFQIHNPNVVASCGCGHSFKTAK